MLMTSLFNGKVKLSFYTSVKRYDIESAVGADMEFDIVTNLNKQPNQAVIRVHNLAQSTQKLFNADHQGIEFFASRNAFDPVKMIFRGETTNVLNEGIIPGAVTTIYAGDGDKVFSSVPFNKAYSGGTLYLTIIRDIATVMSLPTEIDFYDVSAKTLKGVTYSGLCKDVLDEITKYLGLKWSIQQGILEIINLVQPIASQPTAILLSTDTGLIGSPVLVERQEDKQNTKSGKKNKENRLIGVNAVSYLNPEIRPGRLVEIRAMQTINQLGKLQEARTPNISANGIYRADVVRYIGGTLPGNRYDAELEADKMRLVA